MGGISIWQLLIVLVIVLLIFGTKKLRNMGGDVGSAIKNFKGAMKEGEKPGDETAEGGEQTDEQDEGRVIEGEVTSKRKEKV